MMTVSQTTAPVTCTPWCTDGAGHADAEAADEQFCRSAPHTVELAGASDGSDGSWRSRVYVHLYRDAIDSDGAQGPILDRPRIEVVGGEAEDPLSLSTREARELGELLLRLAASADHSSSA